MKVISMHGHAKSVNRTQHQTIKSHFTLQSMIRAISNISMDQFNALDDRLQQRHH